jgi:hypothetical protein
MSYLGPIPIQPTAGGTGVAQGLNTSTLTLGGSLTLSGAHTTAFTITGNTAVTFPTSGTLATTSQLPSITATQYDVLVGGSANSVVSVGPGAAGQLFQSAGAASNPAYTTATYPATATGTGTILRADGTNWSATTATYPNSTTLNSVLYSSSANVIDQVPVVIDGVMISDHAAGLPYFLPNSGTPGWVLTAQAGAPPAWVAGGGGGALLGLNLYCVGPMGVAPYQTIATAVAAATGNTPATIYILPGTYTENVTWISNLSVIGADAFGTTDASVVIAGNQTAIQNSSFANIKFTSASGNTLTLVGSGTYTYFYNCGISASSGSAINGTIPYLTNCTVSAAGGNGIIGSANSFNNNVMYILNSSVSSSTAEAISSTSGGATTGATIIDSIITSTNAASYALLDQSGGQAGYTFTNSQFIGGSSGGGISLDGGFSFGGPLIFNSTSCLYQGGTGINYTAYSPVNAANSYGDTFNASGTYIITGAFPFFYSEMACIGTTSAIDPTATINAGATPGAIGQYISGIYNQNSAGFTTPKPVFVGADGRLGYGASGGGGITTLTGNGAGGATGATVDITTGASWANGSAIFTASASQVLLTPTLGGLILNTAWGLGSMSVNGASFSTSVFNSGFGANSLHAISATGASSNTAMGKSALAAHTTDNYNTAVGSGSLGRRTGASVGGNTAIGANSLGGALTTGDYNTAVGAFAGNSFTTSDSSNICIGYNVAGTVGQSNTLLIGNGTGTGAGQINTTYIQGIYNNNSSGFTSPLAVYIDSTTGQLGYGPTSPAGGSTIVTQFTSSGTFTKNVNTQWIEVYIFGSGGGGGSGGLPGNSNQGGNGGVSNSGYFAAPASMFSATETVTIGTGGTGGVYTSGPADGTAGGATSLGSILIPGGPGGSSTTVAGVVGIGYSFSRSYVTYEFIPTLGGSLGGAGQSSSLYHNGSDTWFYGCQLQATAGGAGSHTLGTAGRGGNAVDLAGTILVLGGLAGTSGGNGGNGNAAYNQHGVLTGGTGGGGGDFSAAGTAGNGGDGAAPGGGGGGGGQSTTGTPGSGGAGGRGEIWVIEHL